LNLSKKIEEEKEEAAEGKSSVNDNTKYVHVLLAQKS
jgi:cell division protein FtsL